MIWMILIPDIRIPKDIIRFPAGNFPNTNGWLLHLNFLFEPQFLQVCMTVAMLPLRSTSTVGLSCLQLKQNSAKMVIKAEENTMNFGSSHGLVPGSVLQREKYLQNFFAFGYL